MLHRAAESEGLGKHGVWQPGVPAATQMLPEMLQDTDKTRFGGDSQGTASPRGRLLERACGVGKATEAALP